MRKHWIDNLRWVTVLLVLFYHVIYFYNNKGVFGGIGGFGDGPQYQDVVMYILYPWFMPLLFLLAGVSARYALEKHSAKEWFRARTRKLLVPATIGLFVFQWMTGYFNTAVANAEELVNVPQPFKFMLWAVSGTGPLWFIQDLWLFSLLLLLVRFLKPKNVYEYILFCAGLGVGFTLLEELMYGGGNPVVALARLPAFGLHVVFGVLMGSYWGLATYNKRQGLGKVGLYRFLGLCLPVLWHTVFDAATSNNVFIDAESDNTKMVGFVFGVAVVIPRLTPPGICPRKNKTAFLRETPHDPPWAPNCAVFPLSFFPRGAIITRTL